MPFNQSLGIARYRNVPVCLQDAMDFHFGRDGVSKTGILLVTRMAAAVARNGAAPANFFWRRRSAAAPMQPSFAQQIAPTVPRRRLCQ